jgi:iron complex transport system permease protein
VTSALPRRALVTYLVLVGLGLAIGAGALLVGQGSLRDPALQATLLDLRATRAMAAFLAGAALAVGGAVVQGLFRNPLASPDILGTSAGALLVGKSAMIAFGVFPALRGLPYVGPYMVLPIGCLLGAWMALMVLLAFVRRRSDNVTLLLTGFILTSLFVSLASFIVSIAEDSWDLARAVVNFSLGGVSGVSRRQILLSAPLVLAGLLATWGWGRQLDVLLTGEEEAAALGVDVGSTRRWLTVWVAVLTGAAVAIGGNVIFVGLIVPHALRGLVGVQHRRLLPASALGGGALVLACDILSRILPTRSEVPLGVITGLIGAPVFLVLLARGRRELAHG